MPRRSSPLCKTRPGQIAQRQTRTARRFVRFQNRAGFVKGVETVGQLEQIIGQNVRPKIIQHLRNDFGELAQPFREIDFRRLGQNQILSMLAVA